MARSRLFHTIVIAGAAITTDGMVAVATSALPACESTGLNSPYDMGLGGWHDIFVLPAPDIAGWPTIAPDIGGWPDIGMPPEPDLSVQDVGGFPDIGIPPDLAERDLSEKD